MYSYASIDKGEIKMSKFFCDSNCELWHSDVEALGINYISMPYTINEEMYYYDLGKNTDIPEFFAKMRAGAVPKTQALNSYDYLQYFEPVFAAGEDIIYVTFSHKMSGTFNYMAKALEELKEKYPERKITVCDTENISLGAGLVVYYAAKLHNEGASDEEVATFVEEIKNRAKCYFTVADLTYLKRGGRVSSFKAFMGTLLDLKPQLVVEDGTLVNFEKSKGRKRSIKDLLSYMERDGVDENYRIFVLNGDCDADVKWLTDMVKEKYPNAQVSVQLIGPVIGSHCGPDTVGLVFVKKA